MKILGARSGTYKRRTAATVAAAALAASVLTLAGPVSSASAAGSCHGGGCSGRDPMATGCAGDAYTRETVNLTSEAKGELRYSPSCDAAWVRTVSWSIEVPISGTVYGQIYWNYKWVSFWAESTPGDVAGRTQWSPMVGGFPHYDISVTG